MLKAESTASVATPPIIRELPHPLEEDDSELVPSEEEFSSLVVSELEVSEEFPEFEEYYPLPPPGATRSLRPLGQAWFDSPY